MHHHVLIPSKHEGFDYCVECGTYKNRNFQFPKEMYEGNYWDGEKHSLFEHQRNNFKCVDEEVGISKVDSIFKFVPKGENFLEIAASPGEVLLRAKEEGYKVIAGIEPSLQYVYEILQVIPQAQIFHGFFPECTANIIGDQVDCIVACDVFEHTDKPEPFLAEIHRLLKVGGTAIIMSPIILHDGLSRQRDFHVEEHAYIYSQRFLEPYLKTIFASVSFDRWREGHEYIILTK